MDNLTRLQRDLLYALLNCDGESGARIREEIEEYYQSSLSQGQVYPNLDILVSRGLVEKSNETGRTNEYFITENGMDRIVDHQQWVASQFEKANATTRELSDVADGQGISTASTSTSP